MATKKKTVAKATETETLNNVIVTENGWSEFPLMLLAFPIWEGGDQTPPPNED